MKLIHKYLILGVAAAGAFTACDNYDADDHKFDNVVYLDVSKTGEVQPATFSNNTPTVEKPIQATLAYPEGQDVAVSLTVDPSLVATYNARYGSDWKMLDAKYYELSSDNVTIHAGKTASEVVTLRLKGLMGEGEQQTGALPIDETYLLPVRISHSSMSVLKGSEAAYYVVKRSSAITVAAQLTDNWIEFPSLDKYGDNSMPWNKLRAMTYEALIYIDDFALTDIQGNPVSISTVMGEEDYALLRIGDTNFEREQLQFDGSGVGFGKFPGRDNTKVLQKGPAALDDKNFIHLARRALYDLWDNETDPGKKDQYKTLGYDTYSEARQFFISYSYNDYRPLNGKIAEARVWSVARTPEQIWENMYNVENPKDDPTLLGYWKFNDGKGNTVKDYSRYGNDGQAKYDLKWPDGIEIPKINEVEE
jgi:hypothetical protein